MSRKLRKYLDLVLPLVGSFLVFTAVLTITVPRDPSANNESSKFTVTQSPVAGQAGGVGPVATCTQAGAQVTLFLAREL